MVLGLDISTTTIGIAILYDNGFLHKLTHLSLHAYNKADSRFKDLEKATAFYNRMLDLKREYEILADKQSKESFKISHVFIEEALRDAKNKNTVNLLQSFNGMCTILCAQVFGVYPIRLPIYDLRANYLPEFCVQVTEKVKKPELVKLIKDNPEICTFKTYPKNAKVLFKSKPDLKQDPYDYIEVTKFHYDSNEVDIKDYIYNKMVREYNEVGGDIKPVYTSTGKFSTANYDMSDAYVTARSGMELTGIIGDL